MPKTLPIEQGKNYGICEQDHATHSYPSFAKLKAIYQGADKEA